MREQGLPRRCLEAGAGCARIDANCHGRSRGQTIHTTSMGPGKWVACVRAWRVARRGSSSRRRRTGVAPTPSQRKKSSSCSTRDLSPLYKHDASFRFLLPYGHVAGIASAEQCSGTDIECIPGRRPVPGRSFQDQGAPDHQVRRASHIGSHERTSLPQTFACDAESSGGRNGLLCIVRTTRQPSWAETASR